MEIAIEKLMSIRQEGTVYDYCYEFENLFNQGKIDEYYAIYLFMDGLELEIREVFMQWHQYSLHKLKDAISLSLKLDANKLKDSFSPYDPNSSLYESHKVFDVMSKNDNGETSEDMGDDLGKDSKVYNQLNIGSSYQDKVTEIQDFFEDDVLKNQKEIDDELPDGFSNETNVCVGLKSLSSLQYNQFITCESIVIYKSSLYEIFESSPVCVPMGVGVGFLYYGKQFKGIDTGWFCILECKGGEIMELKLVKELMDKNKVWEVGLIIERGVNLHQKMLEIWDGLKPLIQQVLVLIFEYYCNSLTNIYSMWKTSSYINNASSRQTIGNFLLDEYDLPSRVTYKLSSSAKRFNSMLKWCSNESAYHKYFESCTEENKDLECANRVEGVKIKGSKAKKNENYSPFY